MSDALSHRDFLTGVDAQFPERWSPRAFDSSPIDESVLARLIEAARWSPSCYNEQPWRFYTSTETTYADYLNLLVDANQGWAQSAPVIGFVIAKNKLSRNGKPNPTYHFDCGAAWMAMSLQARKEGLYTHGMAGIKYPEVADYFGLDSESETVMMGFTIGRMADPDTLSDAMRDSEVPSDRLPIEEIWPSQS